MSVAWKKSERIPSISSRSPRSEQSCSTSENVSRNIAMTGSVNRVKATELGDSPVLNPRTSSVISLSFLATGILPLHAIFRSSTKGSGEETTQSVLIGGTERGSITMSSAKQSFCNLVCAKSGFEGLDVSICSRKLMANSNCSALLDSARKNWPSIVQIHLMAPFFTDAPSSCGFLVRNLYRLCSSSLSVLGDRDARYTIELWYAKMTPFHASKAAILGARPSALKHSVNTETQASRCGQSSIPLFQVNAEIEYVTRAHIFITSTYAPRLRLMLSVLTKTSQTDSPGSSRF
ncbi:hypothetical protein OGATHE_004620 [Ogataea polymorpha]|uniref:Uncharacterized protein n=1 Tax=Ogataea polymorpha TaxID=460523 RepID=A0A9P8P1N7_9ASCO|nr:hypothetical protein OGATHE_004620 [Ogataea polymorpha]